MQNSHNPDEFDPESLPITLDASTTNQPILAERDPEAYIALLEKQASLINRLVAARNAIIRACTFEKDWTVFGSGEKAKACLSAAGALRIADKGNFPIQFVEVSSQKEDIFGPDGVSKIGYRYIFEGYGQMGGRKVHSVGQYSTRDLLLGKEGGEFKDPAEINESYIRQAAHTYFKGKVIKDLLGLGGIPLDEFQKIGLSVARKTDEATQVSYKTGSKGGTSGGDSERQTQLYDALYELAGFGYTVSHALKDGKSLYEPVLPSKELYNAASESGDAYQMLAKASLCGLTTFVGRENNVIAGISDFTRLKGMQLEICLSKAKKLLSQVQTNSTKELADENRN